MVRVADEIRYEDIRPEPIWKKILKGIGKLIKLIVKGIFLGIKAIITYQWKKYEEWDKELEEEKKKKRG